MPEYNNRGGGKPPYRPQGGNDTKKPGYGDKKPYGEKKPYGGGKSYGDKKPYGDRKPYGEKKPYGDKPYGERKPYGDRPYGESGDKRPYGERKPYGEKFYDKPYGEKKPYGDRPYGEKKPYGDKPYGEKKSYGDRPYGEKKPYGDKPYGEKKPYGDKPYGEKKPYGDKPYGDKKPYGDRQYGDRPYGEKKPYGERKPYGDRPYGDRPYSPTPYGRKPYGGEKPYESKKPYAPAKDDAELHEDEALSADKKQRYELKYDAMAPASAGAAEKAKNVPEDELPYLVMGRNAVREALKSGRSIDRILVVKELDGSLREIVNLARDNNVQLREVDRSKLDELCMPFGHGTKTGNHQGIVAMVPGVQYCELTDILEAAKAKDEKPFIILLDGIEDPHNLGSIIRSAECAGAHGVVIPKRRTATVTAAASKASAGAVEYIKVARVANIANTISELKKEGVWIAGADMSGMPMTEAKLEGAIALVIGSEGEGLSRVVREACDFTVKIPLFGNIESLNASVAAAVLMFEKKRQDGIR